MAPANDLATDIATFSGTVTTNQPGLSSTRQVGGLAFTTAAGGWTLSPSGTRVLSIGGSGISTVGQTSGINTISANLGFGGTQIWKAGTGGTLDITGVVSGSNGGTLSFGATGTGTGTIILANTNTLALTGNLNFAAGTVQLAAAGALGSSNNTLFGSAGAVLDLNDNSTSVGELAGSFSIVNNGSGTAVLTFGSNNVNASFNGTIADNNNSGSGIVSVTKTGTGTENFGPANTYTGATSILGGQLELAFNATGAPASNIISASSPLVLGGNLFVNGKAATTNVQTFSSTTLNDAASLVTVNDADTTTNPVLLNLGSITRTNVGVINFAMRAGASVPNNWSNANATNGFTTTTSNTGTAILGGYAVAIMPSASAEYSAAFAVSGASGGNPGAITPLSTYSGGSFTVNNNGALNFTSGGDVFVNGSNDTFSHAGTMNSLTFTRSGGAGVIFASGTTVITTGGILTYTGGNAATNANTIAGGTITSGNGRDLIVNVIDALASREVNLTISSVIADNGSTSIGLTKAGLSLAATLPSELILNAANTFTGATNILTGNLVLANSLALQNSTLNYDNQGGTFGFGSLTSATLGGLSGSQSLPMGGLTALTLGNSNATASNPTYSGAITDGTGGATSLTKIGTNVQTLAGMNSYTGATAVNGGTLALTGSGTTGIGTIAISSGAMLDASATTSRTLSLAAFQALTGTGTVIGDISVGSGLIAPGSLTLGTLTDTGSTTFGTDSTFAETIDSTAGASDILAVSDALTLAGTLSIADLNPGSYAGPYTLATYGGPLTGTFTTITGLPAGYQVDYSQPGVVLLDAVPEPASFGIAAVGLLAMGSLRRRRRVM
jgi:autotransporter-associated beta strand protein